ncbi:hypothetical protein DY000_02062871 [Brassica cretica]|uniref:Uncharacterized protein n=1 Tax=Brassica cretica TaxID=69181 RepID=A0ABQ7AV28_BRACR|nr:hypothetical protein DY000_02062871 [Brassica cretica]
MQNLRMQYFRATQQDYSEAANWVIQALWRERVLGFYLVAWKTSLASKLFSGARLQVKSALIWGGNSSIDSGASFFRWSMMVTSARFSCSVPSFLHQSALVFCCYALVVIALLGDQLLGPPCGDLL